jgi:hypothetical protein
MESVIQTQLVARRENFYGLQGWAGNWQNPHVLPVSRTDPSESQP